MEECEQRKDRAHRCKCLIQSISEKINIHLKQFLFPRYVDIRSKERGGETPATPGAASRWEETRAFVQRALGSWQLLGARPRSRGGWWLRLMVKVERLSWNKFLARWPKKISGRKSISSFRTHTCPSKPCFSELCHQSPVQIWRWNPNLSPIPTRGVCQSGMVTPVPQNVMWSPQLDCALRSQSCGHCKILAKFSGMDALRGNCGGRWILCSPFSTAFPTLHTVSQEWVEVEYLDSRSRQLV